jgi:hypothetical protein
MNQRQKEILQSQLDNEKRTLNELKQVYTQALKDCEKKIAELSSRRDMENLQSIIYQKNYQQALKGQLEGVLEQLHSNEFATVSDYLTRCYEDGYIGVMYDLQGQGIPVIVPIDQEAVTKAIQTDSKLSKPLYDSLGEDINKLKRSVRAEVSRGIANGSTWNQVAGKLALSFKNTPFNSAYNRAMTIARTEGHRIQIQSADHAQHKAKEKGADVVKQWDATLDGKTRPHHRELDGQIRELDEHFEVGGTTVMYPGGFGDPAEDCNCRCALLQRAKWSLDDAELNTLKERAEYFGLDKTKDFEDFKGKYLKISDEDIEKLDKNGNIKVKYSEAHNELKKYLDKLGVEYNPVKMHDKALTEEQIINEIAGGDKTSGSCASLGLAYIGQKHGINVLDFRGGESQNFFSTKYNLEQIAKFVKEDKVKMSVARSYITSGNRLLKEVEKGKEYYFVCGRHAAIVRKTDEDIIQYLELQSSRQNGWMNFNGNPRHTLATRFGCTNTSGRDVSGFMIDVDAFKDSEDLKSILGYINTDSDKQKKGVGGYAK